MTRELANPGGSLAQSRLFRPESGVQVRQLSQPAVSPEEKHRLHSVQVATVSTMAVVLYAAVGVSAFFAHRRYQTAQFMSQLGNH